MITQFGQGYLTAELVAPKQSAARVRMSCRCAHPACGKDFGDPAGLDHGKTNFISWALWVIGHCEVAHEMKVELQPSEVGRLLNVEYQTFR